MEVGILGELGIRASFGLSALGAIIGGAVVGSATIGAWKKAIIQKKTPSFLLLAFAGQPFSNTIYGFITMNTLMASAASGALNEYQLLFMGIFAGIGIGSACYVQCYCGAVAGEAYVETGQGYGHFLIIIGICETLALLSMVFTIMYA
jgi:V/A-type H+-transporting ATPase subunit K